MQLLKQRFEEMMTWIPIVLGSFKLLALCACAFFAIKSHRDGERREKAQEEERQREKERENASSGL